MERRGDGGILLKVVVVIYLGVAILFIFYFLFVYDYVELNDYGLFRELLFIIGGVELWFGNYVYIYI